MALYKHNNYNNNSTILSWLDVVRHVFTCYGLSSGFILSVRKFSVVFVLLFLILLVFVLTLCMPAFEYVTVDSKMYNFFF